MDKLAMLPFFLTLFLLYKGWDSHKTFVMYFLPVLTLIPAYYDTKLISGIPEFTFWSSALIPIIMFWLFKDKLAGHHANMPNHAGIQDWLLGILGLNVHSGAAFESLI